MSAPAACRMIVALSIIEPTHMEKAFAVDK